MALVRPDSPEANAPLLYDLSFNDPPGPSFPPPSMDSPPSIDTPLSLAPPSEALLASDSQSVPSLDAMSIPKLAAAASEEPPQPFRSLPPALPESQLPAREREATTPLHAASDVRAGRPRRLGRPFIVAAVVGILAGGVFALSRGKTPEHVVAVPSPVVATKTVNLAPQEIPASPDPSATPTAMAAESAAPAEGEPAPAAPGSASAGAAPEPAPAESGVPAPAVAPGEAKPLMACLLDTLPQGTLSSGAHVGFLCDQTEIWTVARRFNQEVARTGSGAGLVQWAHLARFDLAAISTLRSRCCPGAPPFSVATPRGLCSTLEDATADVGKNPAGAAAVDAYAQGVDCLVSKGVRYPEEWWDRVAAKDARGYFEKFVGTLK
jgi:hypothetical protein